MQVTETLSDGLKRGYTVVVPAADIESKRAKRIAELSRDLRLPGFRPGKVPANLVRKRYGGAVTAEVLEASVNDATTAGAGRSRLALGRPAEGRGHHAWTRRATLNSRSNLSCCPTSPCPSSATSQLTRLKSEPSPETVDRALGEIAQRQRVAASRSTEERAAERWRHWSPSTTPGTIDGDGLSPAARGRTWMWRSVAPASCPASPNRSRACAPARPAPSQVTFPADYTATELAGKDAQLRNHREGALKRSVRCRRWTMPWRPRCSDSRGLDADPQAHHPAGAARIRPALPPADQAAAARRAGRARPLPGARQGMVDAEFSQIWERLEADRKAGQAWMPTTRPRTTTR